MSTVERPMALVTPGKSSAMRAGVWIAKPVGTAASGCEKSIRTTSAPPCIELVTDSIAFCACASADRAERQQADAGSAQPLCAIRFVLASFRPLLQLQCRRAFDPFTGGVLHDFTQAEFGFAHTG